MNTKYNANQTSRLHASRIKKNSEKEKNASFLVTFFANYERNAVSDHGCLSLVDMLILSQSVLSIFEHDKNVCIYAGDAHAQLYIKFWKTLNRATAFDTENVSEKIIFVEKSTVAILKMANCLCAATAYVQP